LTISKTTGEAMQRVISLYAAAAGQWLKIHSAPDGPLRSHCIRLGIHEGERAKCIERLPGGTIVLQKNRQQIAIGHALAKQIMVIILPNDTEHS